MDTKWDGQESVIAVNTVGSDVLALASTPNCAGPYRLRGAPPPELRASRYWFRFDGSNNATAYTSLADLKASRGPVTIASWDLSPDVLTTTATTFAFDSVDHTVDTLTKTAHGMVTGQGPIQLTTATTLPTGLSLATDYYVIRIDANTMKLASTRANAVALTAVTFSDNGTGAHTLTLFGVDTSDDGLLSAGHGMQTGDGPVRVTTGGGLPAGLSAGVDYYVIRIDADRFKLATSAANALAGTAVNLTTKGSGTHQLVRALNIGKDLTADGIFEWLAQGVRKEEMQAASAGSWNTVFDR